MRPQREIRDQVRVTLDPVRNLFHQILAIGGAIGTTDLLATKEWRVADDGVKTPLFEYLGKFEWPVQWATVEPAVRRVERQPDPGPPGRRRLGRPLLRQQFDLLSRALGDDPWVLASDRRSKPTAGDQVGVVG